jgi:hypothetical protein
MICAFFVIFADSGQTDTEEKCLVLQGFQQYIAAGDSVALTGLQEWIALEEAGDGMGSIDFSDVLLARLDERDFKRSG